MVAFRLVDLFQLCVAFYVIISIGYTTRYILLYPVDACLSRLFMHDAKGRGLWFSFWPSVTMHNHIEQSPRLSNEMIYWSANVSNSSYGQADIQTPMSEDLFLSKAFSQSMKPSKIIPFFYRGKGTFDEDDITVTTLITKNRFHVFARLVERYDGGSLSNSVFRDTQDFSCRPYISHSPPR
jgi:hypothetical protein